MNFQELDRKIVLLTLCTYYILFDVILLDYCGGNFTEDNGNFSSPSFPDAYLRNLDCLYTIKLENTSLIRITSQTFRTEENFDLLEYGIETANGTVSLGSFSGHHEMVDFEVVASTLWFRFTSDYAVEDTGFTILWDSEGKCS